MTASWFDAQTDCGGKDTEGAEYEDIASMWQLELGSSGECRDAWYRVGAEYWEARDADLNGVLGGFPETHEPDIEESRLFLEAVRAGPTPPSFGTCIDCGAGIGRVTGGVLFNYFELVDLLEPNEKLLEAARREHGGNAKAGRLMCSQLQTFDFDPARYDVFWLQWVLLYLPDDDLQSFLEKCKTSLRPGGMILIKENMVVDGAWLVDKEDNSIARTDQQYEEAFAQAGFSVVHKVLQKVWPEGLIPVFMYAIRLAEG